MKVIDKIRQMPDEELARLLVRADTVNGAACLYLEACDTDLETDTSIPLSRCAGCMLNWLHSEAGAALELLVQPFEEAAE